MKEIFLKERKNEQEEIYFQEMAFMEKTRVLEFIRSLIEFKNKPASIKVSKEGRYFAEIIWPLRKEDGRNIFENVITLLPNLEKESLIIAGKKYNELSKKDWSDKKKLKKIIREAFNNPAIRSNQDFVEAGF